MGRLLHAFRRFGRATLPLVLACLALVAASPAAAREATLDGTGGRLDLWPAARILPDPEGALSVEAALAARERFAIPGGAYATLGLDKGVVWLRVPYVAAEGGAGPWIFDLDYALLRRVDVIHVVGDRVAGTVRLGDAEPFANRPLRSRTHSTPIEVPAGARGEILLRIDTAGAKILPISLERPAQFHSRALAEQMLQGALACLGFFLLVFSLTQWYHLREALYVKYALLVVFSVMFSVHYFGIGEMYLWTDVEWPERHLAGVTSLLAAAATALFVEDALAGDLHRWLRRGLRAVAVIHVLAAVAHGADLIDIRVVAVFMSTTGLMPALMGLPGALAKARRGDSVGHWFMAAWVGYFVASAVLVGVVRGRVGVDFWTMHSFQFGATFDMLIFMRIALLRTATRHREAQRAAQERDALFSLAHSDPLTGLLNRRGLADALSASLERTSDERLLALYVLDLDGFKPVNDQYGHDVGDALLRAVAQRLRGCVRAGDGVARFGGDEFVVMADGLTHPAQAQDVGMKLLESFHEPFALSTHRCSLKATIGFALAPLDARDADGLVKAADAAMYAGKQGGKNRLVRTADEVVTA